MKEIILILICVSSTYAQVGIFNTTPQAELDVSSTQYGIVFPQIPLISVNQESPVINPQNNPLIDGTLVFNTTVTSELSKGFYYWNTSIWSTFGSSNTNWALSGNLNTTPINNFIGTKTNQSFFLKTNNTERLAISENGNIRIASSTFSSKLNIDSNIANNSGLKFTHLTATSPSSVGKKIGIDNLGNVILLKDIDIIPTNQYPFNSFLVNDLDYTEIIGSNKDFSIPTHSKITFINVNAGLDFYNVPNNSGNGYYEIRLFLDGNPTEVFMVQQEKNIGTSMSTLLKGTFNLSTGNHIISLKMKRIANNGTTSGSNLLVNLISYNSNIFYIN